MSTVICMATSKGGPGKSTLTVILASVYSASKYSVLIIDADAQQRLASEWYDPTRLPDNISVTTATHATIADKISWGRARFDVVIVDVEGSASLTLANGVFNADCVLIPANKSTMDVKDAMATASLVAQYNASGGQPRAYGIVWNRVQPAIRSRETDNTAKAAIDANIPIVFEVCERAAYRSLFSYGTILSRLDKREVPGIAKATEEALRFAEAVAECIVSAQQKEVA